jgi:hopanoid C-3 methylase
MKILLVQPEVSSDAIVGDLLLMEPLALEYLAAGLKSDYDVRLLDLRFDNDLERVLKEFCPDIVGTTGYTVHVKRCKDILKKVKQFNKDIVNIIGGHHATVAPQDFYEPFVDIIVIGEGVFAMKEIAETIERKGDLKKVNGLAIRENGLFRRTNARANIDLDSLPFPDRSCNPSHRDRYCLGTEKPVALLRTSLGCAFKCIYCAQWKISGEKYLTRKPKYIFEELAAIKEPYIFFADDEAFLDADRMMELARLIKEAGIKKKYHLYARADTIVNHAGLIEKWKEIGLSYVAVGFESFSDYDLKYLNKNTSAEINEKAMRIITRNNIVLYANFIVRPDFTREDFQKLKGYVREKKLYNPKFPIYTPFPGTDYYESVKPKVMFDDYELYDFKHALTPTKLPIKEFYQEYINLQKYTVPRLRAYIDLIKRPLAGIIPLILKRRKSLSNMRKGYGLKQ